MNEARKADEGGQREAVCTQPLQASKVRMLIVLLIHLAGRKFAADIIKTIKGHQHVACRPLAPLRYHCRHFEYWSSSIIAGITASQLQLTCPIARSTDTLAWHYDDYMQKRLEASDAKCQKTQVSEIRNVRKCQKVSVHVRNLYPGFGPQPPYRQGVTTPCRTYIIQ